MPTLSMDKERATISISSGPTRSYATFRSTSFNLSDDRKGTAHAAKLGNDLAEHIAGLLKKNGWTIDGEVGQDDDGWYLTYYKLGKPFDLIVQLLDARTGLWLCWIEPGAAVLPSLLGARKRPIPRDPAEAIHKVLSNDPNFGDLRWFTREEFLAGKEGKAHP